MFYTEKLIIHIPESICMERKILCDMFLIYMLLTLYNYNTIIISKLVI